MMKNKKKKLCLNFDLEFQDIKELNSSFALGRVAIAYAGRNRNRSDISVDAFNNAMGSINNIPVVGRFIPEADDGNGDFGSHDITIMQDKDGISIVNATVPYGVVPESANQYWQDIEDDDGNKRPYLFTDIILWKRQYGYDCIEKKKKFGQSMEINVLDYSVDSDGYSIIKKFEFEALCILGQAEPCFEDASVQLYSAEATSSYKLQFSAMLDELKELMNQQPIKIGFDNSNSTEGGKQKLNQDKINKILAEYETTLEKVGFEVTEDMTEEVFRAKLDEFKSNEEKNNFSATYNQKREAVQSALSAIYKGDGDTEIYFWICDMDDEKVYVEKEVYHRDSCERDCMHGAFSYTFDETTMTATITSEFIEMFMQWLTKEEKERLDASRSVFEQLQADFNAYKKDYFVANAEVEELRQFKAARLSEDHKQEVDSVLAEFEDLSENEEFVAFAAKAVEYEDMDALREKCFAIRGKSIVPAKFTAKPVTTGRAKAPIDTKSLESEFDPYPGAEAYLK